MCGAHPGVFKIASTERDLGSKCEVGGPDLGRIFGHNQWQKGDALVSQSVGWRLRKKLDLKIFN